MPSIHFTVTAEDKNLQRVLKEIEKGVQGTSDKVKESGDDIDGVFDKITKGAAAMAAAFSATQLVKNIANVRGEFQQLEVAFTTMLQSEEKANDLMAQLTETAAVTPFGLQEVAGGAKQLLAYGVAAENVNDSLVMLGDIAAGLSIPLNDLVYLYGTTMTQGRMFTQDLRQFQGRGIPLADELAKQFGVTKDKVAELVTTGKVGFDNMHKALVAMTSEGGKFGGLMEAQSKTIKGQISNIEDAIDVMFNQIGQANEGVINSALSITSVLVENYQKIGAILEPLVVTYGAYKVALMVASAVTKTKALTTGLATTAERAHYLALLASEKAQKALNLQMLKNPYALAAAAVIALTYGIYKYVTRASAAERATKELNNALGKINEESKKEKEAVDELVSTFGNLDVAEGKRIENFIELKQKYPDILANINTENEFLERKAELLGLINQRQKESTQAEKKALLESYEHSLANAEQTRRDLLGGAGAGQGGYGQMLRENQAEIEKYKLMIQELKAEIASVDVEKYLGGIKEMSDADITSAVADIENVLKTLAGASEKAIGSVKSLGGEFSKGQLQTILGALQQQQTNRKESDKGSAADWVAKYKKDYEDAEKAIKDFMAKKDEMSLEQFETGLKKLTEARDEAKKKYESTDNSVKDDKKNADELDKITDETLKAQRENEQRQIDLLKESGYKKRQQIELNYKLELDEIAKQEREWKKAQGKLTDEQVRILEQRRKLAEQTKAKDTKSVEDEENRNAAAAMNAYLKEYGKYEEKKAAIKAEYAEKRKNAEYAGDIMMLNKEEEAEIAALDDSVREKTSTIAKLFEDMSKKSVEYMRSIVEEAKEMYAYLQRGIYEEVGNTGKDKFGFTKEQFNVTRDDAEKMKAIGDGIKEVNETADEAEGAVAKLTRGFKELFEGDLDSAQLQDSLRDIGEGINQVLGAVGFLSDSLSQISDAFGGNFLGGIAEGLNVAMDAVNSTMQGAQAGAAFGPWGAAAGAAIGLVGSLTSSLSKLHDKKHEKSIQRIQGEIEGLKDDYDKLGEAIEKAYSMDASNKIKEQNDLLEQQKKLIQQQIAEEESKKKTDKGRIEEWEAEIDNINKKIEENKEKAIDAIFGEDLQAAINNFADAYADALSSAENDWESVRDTVKQMMQNMVKESIKSALQSSDAIKKIREQLLKFYEDSILTQAEQDAIYKMAEDVQKELDKQFGWAENLFKDETSTEQNATYGGFEAMSEETGSELNGRFTALQMAGEEIKNQMIASVVALNTLVTSAGTGNSLLSDILTQHAITNAYLEDIVKYSKVTAGYGAKLDKIVEQTKNL